MAATSIRIFLPDGNPDGVRLVYKTHWTGIAVSCPRARYGAARTTRDEFRTPGVYVLSGPPDDAKFESRIYVGEGEDPRGRLDSHHTTKEFWNRLVLFTSFGQALNKATIRYIESRLLELAVSAGRAELDNANVPAAPHLSEPDREDAEAFLSDTLTIYPLLGINAFEPLEQSQPTDRLYLNGPDAKGEGAETDDGFVVYGGAHARAKAVESMPGWVSGLRETLTSSGLLVPMEDSNVLRLVTDHEFKSPSAAAAVLLGRSAAGTIEWKNSDGKNLKSLREASVADTPSNLLGADQERAEGT